MLKTFSKNVSSICLITALSACGGTSPSETIIQEGPGTVGVPDSVITDGTENLIDKLSSDRSSATSANMLVAQNTGLLEEQSGLLYMNDGTPKLVLGTSDVAESNIFSGFNHSAHYFGSDHAIIAGLLTDIETINRQNTVAYSGKVFGYYTDSSTGETYDYDDGRFQVNLNLSTLTGDVATLENFDIRSQTNSNSTAAFDTIEIVDIDFSNGATDTNGIVKFKNNGSEVTSLTGDGSVLVGLFGVSEKSPAEVAGFTTLNSSDKQGVWTFTGTK